jgi:hypothetical protein
VGSKNKVPSSKNDVDRLKAMFDDAALSEYIFSNEEKLFKGNSLELMQAVYKAEVLPVKLRLYAATRAVEFEPRLRDDQLLDAVFSSVPSPPRSKNFVR